jgi:hypothetical protein
MHLFGPRDATAERVAVGVEGRLHAALQALHERKVVPAIRQSGPLGEDALIGVFGLPEAPGTLQRLCFADFGFGGAVHALSAGSDLM